MSPAFVPGLELARRLYAEAVRPLLDSRFPGIPHTAALIGDGSDVLGFDDAQSTDHAWGPRLLLFLGAADLERHAAQIDTLLSEALPTEIAGHTTNFSEPDPTDGGTRTPQPTPGGRIRHQVEVHTIRGWVRSHLDFDTEMDLEPSDWLSFSEQRLLTLVEGAVFHDDLDLAAVRRRFAYYDREVWLYLLFAGWARIGQEDHLMGRAGQAADGLGSALIAARLVRDVMRLCFVMERTYAPYAKWFGTAFGRLRSGPELGPTLTAVLAARTWQEREEHLVVAYEHLARKHNRLALADPLDERVQTHFNRPFRVIGRNGFTEQLRGLITDPRVRRIAERPPIGMIDQFSDSTDLLSYVSWRPALRALYE